MKDDDFDRLMHEVKTRARIEEVISFHVPLKPKYGEFVGLCPFHAEKTPSFTVIPKKGFYFCFGCHAKGDAIGFLQEFHDISFMEALRYLARDYSIAWPSENSNQNWDGFEQQIARELRESMRTYPKDLLESIGRNEREEREPSGPLELPPNFYPLGDSRIQSINDYALSRGFSWKQLCQLGLGGCLFGPYSGCLVLPVYYKRELVFWQARDALGRQNYEKYRTPKGRSRRSCLFNLEVACEYEWVILCEGIFSALRAGPDAVATFGNTISGEQMDLLEEHGVKKVIYAHDPDVWRAEQGQSDTMIALTSLKRLARRFEVKYVRLQKDPDDTGTAVMRELLSRAKSVTIQGSGDTDESLSIAIFEALADVAF